MGKSALWRVNLSTPHDQDGGEGEGRDKTQGIRAKAATAADPWDELEAQLDGRVASQAASGPSLRYPVHLSPWLEKTGWTTHLRDHNLWTVAELLAPPTPTETSLIALLSSFDELIKDARASVLSEKVNVFALHRVNSFVRGRHFKKPLHTKLLNGTYQRYQAVWHKLLCYMYRLTIAHQGPDLHYILTPDQLEAISQIPASTLPTRSESVVGQPSRSSPSSSSFVCAYPTSSPTSLRTARSRVFTKSPAITLLTSPPLRSSPPYCFQKRAVVTAPADHSSSEEESTVSEYDCVTPSTPSRSPQPAHYQEEHDNHEQSATEENPAGSDLRDACLGLCISLLDHKLEGRLTDSIVVGFLAALGINKSCDGFDDAVLFLPKLSALVKLSQLLLVQHAVVAHKTGHAKFPNELVAEMQDRFMVYGSETPMN
ncbi:unnamed protein product [Periconia digitata]|uniref:Uncharacterized protein n=1 Tax=Periconia digitata TaxID=1303443 RepID=A0A9W4UR87_9PLEO|nr:unnamed protein product [Periconia digitata]